MRLNTPFALLLALAAAHGVVAQDDFDVEVDPRGRSPLAQAERAWQQARAELPAGHEVRRLVFADHILAVFHAPPGDPAITLTGFVYVDGRLQGDGGEPAEQMQCSAPGVDAAGITTALQALLATPEWQRNAARVHSLTLECIHGPRLYWHLSLVPEGGFVAGQPIPTLELPFGGTIR